MAMKKEMKALEESDSCELTPLPKGRSVAGGRWVCSVKIELSNSSEEKFKARYVAKGYSRIKGYRF